MEDEDLAELKRRIRVEVRLFNTVLELLSSTNSSSSIFDVRERVIWSYCSRLRTRLTTGTQTEDSGRA